MFLAWCAVALGGVLMVLALIGGVAGIAVPGVGGRVEPRLDALGHLLLGGALLTNSSMKLSDSHNSTVAAIGTVLGVAGVAVIVRARVRAARSAQGQAGR